MINVNINNLFILVVVQNYFGAAGVVWYLLNIAIPLKAFLYLVELEELLMRPFSKAV